MKTPYRTPSSLLLCVAIECVFATQAPAQMPTQENQFTQLLLGPMRARSASGP